MTSEESGCSRPAYRKKGKACRRNEFENRSWGATACAYI